MRDSSRLLCDVIVADGGSEDDTVQMVQSWQNPEGYDTATSLVEGARGRGPQMNLGAAKAGGDVFWFLHADAHPHPLSLREIARARSQGYHGGNFRLRFAAPGVWPRAFESIARAQRRVGMAYGDSGIWVCREQFERLGGFAAWPLFEDYDFWQRLRQSGSRLYHSRLPLRVSARRFETQPGRTLLLWLRLQWAYNRGVSPHALAQIYRNT